MVIFFDNICFLFLLKVIFLYFVENRILFFLNLNFYMVWVIIFVYVFKKCVLGFCFYVISMLNGLNYKEIMNMFKGKIVCNIYIFGLL